MSIDVYLEMTRGKREPLVLFRCNITHNLTKMWAEAGIYSVIYDPTQPLAGELVKPLLAGLKLMGSDPPRFQKYDAPNGWGLYVHAVPWLAELTVQCALHPKAVYRINT